MQVTLIAGLPGSGKTTLATQLASVIGESAIVIDDPSRFEALDVLLDPGLAAAVITHPAFCTQRARATVEREVMLRRPEAILSWIFFANDPAACQANAQFRADGREVEDYIRRLSRSYAIPDGASVRPVYRPAGATPRAAPR